MSDEKLFLLTESSEEDIEELDAENKAKAERLMTEELVKESND